MLTPTFTPNFSLGQFSRKSFLYGYISVRYFATPPPTAGHQTYHADTKFTRRAQNLPHEHQSPPKSLGWQASGWEPPPGEDLAIFRRQLSIWSKVKRMWNHPVFCNKVGVRVGYLTVLDLTVQIISQLAIDMEAHSLNVASSVFVVELAQVWFVTLNRNKFTSETESTTNNCKNYHVTVHTHVQGRIFLTWIDLVLQ